MNMTSILTRALILVAFGAGVSLAIANRVERTHSPATVATSTSVAIHNVPVPTNVVELPTISVRPTTKELADAINGADDRDVSQARVVPASNHQPYIRTVTPTLPTLGMDMPYYSFGKALPRVSKE